MRPFLYIIIQSEYLYDYTKMEIKFYVKNVEMHQKGKMEVVEETYVNFDQALDTHV